MLVLSRKKNEGIMIDNDIEVFVVDIDDNKVKIGITAPKHISVLRTEVYEKIRLSNKEAMGGDKRTLDEFRLQFKKSGERKK